MLRVDHYILEFMGECAGAKLTPRVISKNIQYDRSYVSKRLKELSTHELVTDHGEGFYQITDRGLAYLAGELAVSELEPDENEK